MSDTCENCGKPLGGRDTYCYTCWSDMDEEEKQSVEVDVEDSIFDGVDDV